MNPDLNPVVHATLSTDGKSFEDLIDLVPDLDSAT